MDRHPMSMEEYTYLEMLLDIVCTEDQKIKYLELFMKLYDTDFVYLVSNRDVDRAMKGMELRHSLCFYKTTPCSVLEMMIALAIDVNGVAGDGREGDRSSLFFWVMLESLGLSDMVNEAFDEALCDNILSDFMTHRYEYNGAGGLFTLKRCYKDVRKMEIWAIACHWMNEYLGLE